MTLTMNICIAVIRVHGSKRVTSIGAQTTDTGSAPPTEDRAMCMWMICLLYLAIESRRDLQAKWHGMSKHHGGLPAT